MLSRMPSKEIMLLPSAFAYLSHAKFEKKSANGLKACMKLLFQTKSLHPTVATRGPMAKVTGGPLASDCKGPLADPASSKTSQILAAQQLIV